MEHSPKPEEKMIIAHWTYTREEWKAFLKWKVMQKGFLHYILYWLYPLKQRKVPEIRIMPGKVYTNDNHEPFHEEGRRFRRIYIHDAGKFNINIMAISYEAGSDHKEIRILIPKGKLKEAIQVQEKILGNHLLGI